MSLISFHRFLIGIAIVFCVGYGGWELTLWWFSREASGLVMGIVFLLLGAGLGYYLSRLRYFLGYDTEIEGRPERT